MADYIHLNILSQSYIHIEPVNMEDERLEEFRAYMEEFVTLRSRFFLHPDVEIDIALREGSLKSYATVLGTFATVYIAIGNYGDFRQGLSILHEDCKRVAETVCSESLFQAQARHPDIVRVEARTGVVGSIRKLVADLDTLSRLSGDISANDMALRLSKIRDETQTLLDNLGNDEDRIFAAARLGAILNDTPGEPKPSRKRGELPIHFANYRQERRRFHQLLAKYVA